MMRRSNASKINTWAHHIMWIHGKYRVFVAIPGT